MEGVQNYNYISLIGELEQKTFRKSFTQIMEGIFQPVLLMHLMPSEALYCLRKKTCFVGFITMQMER
jgi:hypothetical protein